MTRTTIATIAVWMCATSSALALTYTLNRPMLPPPQAERTPPPPADAPATKPHPSDSVASVPAPEVVSLPPVQIAVTRRRAVAPANVVADLPRALSEMRCSGWKSLASGPADQVVRYCE